MRRDSEGTWYTVDEWEKRVLDVAFATGKQGVAHPYTQGKQTEKQPEKPVFGEKPRKAA